MTDDYDPVDDCYKSVAEAQRIIRARMLAGGPGWTPHKYHPLCNGCCKPLDFMSHNNYINGRSAAIRDGLGRASPRSITADRLTFAEGRDMNDPFPFDLPVDDDPIPAFLRLTAEERTEAWKGRKLTKPSGDTKQDYSVPRSLDAAGRAILKEKDKAEAARLKALRKR